MPGMRGAAVKSSSLILLGVFACSGAGRVGLPNGHAEDPGGTLLTEKGLLLEYAQEVPNDSAVFVMMVADYDPGEKEIGRAHV